MGETEAVSDRSGASGVASTVWVGWPRVADGTGAVAGREARSPEAGSVSMGLPGVADSVGFGVSVMAT